jgi:hypothetical protein
LPILGNFYSEIGNAPLPILGDFHSLRGRDA